MIVPQFAELAMRSWAKADNPLDIIVDYDGQDKFKSPVLHRTCELHKEISWTIKFTTDRKLTNIALALDEHREKFRLKSIKNDHMVTIRNDQSWYLSSDPPPEYDHFDPSNELLAMIDNDDSRSHVTKNQANIEITVVFESNTYGTFRQDVLVGFSMKPIVRVQICMDCVPPSDLARLELATKSLLSQYHLQYNDVRVKFPSDSKNRKDDILKAMYPLPKADNFMLTHDTLTENDLTPCNYRNRLRLLARVEEAARLEQVSRYDISTMLHCINKYTLTNDGDGSTVAKYTLSGELYAKINLERECTEDIRSGRLLIRGCDSVYLTPVKIPYANCPQYEARIEDKCSDSIYIKLCPQMIQDLNLTENSVEYVHVQFVLNRVSYCEWQRAIDCIPDTRIVFPPSKWRGTSTGLKESNSYFSFDQLNSEQKLAVKLMTEPRNTLLPPVLILGSFGTGKTFTIAQGLRRILQCDPKAKILLCTHSNSAADLYVKEYFGPWYDMSKNSRFKPMRIYYTERARNTVNKEVIRHCLVDEDGNFRYPTHEDLSKNKQLGLIITTLSTSSCLLRLSFEPTHIVIDEAAQALECEAITPLGLATFETRLILAGDQMQLSPEVYSDLAKERGFGVSLLERLHLLYSFPHPYRVWLRKNYRAHSRIISLMAELFYGCKQLQPAATSLYGHPEMGSLVCHAVLGFEEKSSDSSGYWNDAEVHELVRRIKDLKSNWPSHLWGSYGESSIGVLVHYKEQVQRVRNALRWARMPEVSVERVLNVQGKQFTVVFISTVRTRFSNRFAVELDVHDYGFFTNPRLLNTAVTRAKCLVAVVGDPLALMTIGKCRFLWHKFVVSSYLTGCNIHDLLQDVDTVEEFKSSRLNPFAKEFVPAKSPSSSLYRWHIGPVPSCPTWAPQDPLSHATDVAPHPHTSGPGY